MKISLVTPAGKQSRAGNRTTAERWARILRDLGHRVNVSQEDSGAGADLMVHEATNAYTPGLFPEKGSYRGYCGRGGRGRRRSVRRAAAAPPP